MKNYLHIILVTITAFAIHKYILLPQLDIRDTVPVVFQHLLLGGFSLLIYAVSEFMVKNFFSLAGFSILGFLVVKMIALAIFINFHEKEIEIQPIIKYLLVGFYFLYLVITLLKIIPLLNVDLPENEKKPLKD